MPITFTKSQLVAALKDALAGHDKADVEYQRDTKKYIADRIKDVDTLPQIRALRDSLTAFLKSGRTPARADVDKFRRAAGVNELTSLYAAGPSDYDVRSNVKRPLGWLDVQMVAKYEGLIRMLEANTDETITANQLKLFGYEKLEPIFRLAALNGANGKAGQ